MSVKKTAFILMIVAGVFVMSSVGSYAFDAASLEKLKATKECQACDLTNADLSKANLRGAKLMEAKFPLIKRPAGCWDPAGAITISGFPVFDPGLTGSPLSSRQKQRPIGTGVFHDPCRTTGF